MNADFFQRKDAKAQRAVLKHRVANFAGPSAINHLNLVATLRRSAYTHCQSAMAI
jgi:hypothetical protein